MLLAVKLKFLPAHPHAEDGGWAGYRGFAVGLVIEKVARDPHVPP